MSASNDDLLGCGRSIDSVWETLDGLPDEHQVSCEYCIEAREQLLALYELTQEVRSEQEAEPLSTNLTDRIMKAARTQVRRGRRIPVERTPDSVIEASEYAISAVVRGAVDSVDGAVARTCRIRTLGEEPNGVVRIGVEASITVSGYRIIPQIQDELRDVIAQDVRARLGLLVSKVDLVVEDIHGI